MNRFFEFLDSSSSWLLFIFFCLCMWLFGFLNSEFVVTDELYDQYMESKMQEKYGDNYNELASEFDEENDTSIVKEEILEFTLDIITND